ncbi:MAG: EamA family transporter [Candidatus Competibacteraceae bacterium]|nr:EamA family transporter [Candidatus Competibacteraceae bacterium]
MPETSAAHTPATASWTDWLLLSALVAMWGSSFMLTKIAVSTLPPIVVVTARLFIATVILLGLVYATKQRLPGSGRLWLFLIAIAIIGNCLPFFLISWGQQQIDSGLAGILMAIMPLFTLTLAHFFLDGERLHSGKISGFVLGFIGIVMLLGPEAWQGLRNTGPVLIAQLAVLGGALCYAVNSIIARRRPPSDPLLAAAGVMLVASIIMLPTACVIEPPWQLTPSLNSLLAVIGLGVMSTAAASVVYFKLISSAGPSFVSQINYLIPLWAVVVGIVFLGEQPRWNALAALLLILSGIALAQWTERRRKITCPSR